MSTSVEKQILELSHTYLRHGGKQNRRQQIHRLILACKWITARHQLNHIKQIGCRQINDFYAQHQALSDSTLYGYYCAFCILWNLIDRSGEPPRPKRIMLEVDQ